MALATSLRSVASKLMGKFGGDITFRQITSGAYNASTGTSAETATDTNIKGVLQDVSRSEVNDLVQAGDKRLTVAASDLPVVPTTADKVVISNRVHQIVRVDTTEQNNEPIIYDLTLRD